MCRKVICNNCKKITWAGCGAHVEQVLRDVKEEDRCKCREQKSSSTPTSDSNPWSNGGFNGRR